MNHRQGGYMARHAWGAFAARAVLVATASALAWAVSPKLPMLDDAYIPLHSAHVLVSGVDLAFGEPALVGATSLPYVAALVPFVWAGVNDLTVLRLISAASLVTFALAVYALGFVLRLRMSLRVVLIGFGVACGGTFIQLTNGLETGFAMAAVLFAITAVLSGRIWAVAILTGLLPCVRPDLAFVAAAIWMYTMLQSRSRVLLIIPLLVALPWLLWAYYDTGSPLPNTIQAKRIFFAEGCLPILERTEIAMYCLVGWSILVAPALIVSAPGLRSRFDRWLLIAVGITLIPFWLMLPSALGFNEFRYLYPIGVPLLVLGAAQSTLSTARYTIALIVALLVAPLQFTAWQRMRDYGDELQGLRKWADTHIPSGSVVLTHDAGALSMGSFHLVDVVGLKTPQSVETNAALTYSSCGLRRSDALRTILHDHPGDYLIVTTGWDRVYHIAESFGVRRPIWRGASEYAYVVYALSARSDPTTP